MKNEEVRKRVAEIIDELMESYQNGIYGHPMKPDLNEESMIRISHELITLYRVLNLFRE